MRNKNTNRQSAFTLIELLVVMGIMVLLSMVVVGGYVGMTRAIAARAGINHLRNAVLLTRQHACMDGQRTYLYVLSESTYVMCRRVGVVTKSSSGTFSDFYSDLRSFVDLVPRTVEDSDRLKLYNLSLTSRSTTEEPFVYVGSDLNENPVRENRRDGGWVVDYKPAGKRFFDVGDSYGIEVYPVRTLPKGFVFHKTRSVNKRMYFEPSGSPSQSIGQDTDTLIIYEEINPTLEQSVSVRNGRITVETKGTEK